MNGHIPYPKMYAILCGAASDALESIENNPAYAAAILQKALLEAEALYIDAGEDAPTLGERQRF